MIMTGAKVSAAGGGGGFISTIGSTKYINNASVTAGWMNLNQCIITQIKRAFENKWLSKYLKKYYTKCLFFFIKFESFLKGQYFDYLHDYSDGAFKTKLIM